MNNEQPPHKSPYEAEQSVHRPSRLRGETEARVVTVDSEAEVVDGDRKIQQSGISDRIIPEGGLRLPRPPTADFDGDTPSNDSLSFGWMMWTPVINEALQDYVGRYARVRRPGLSSLELHRRCYNNLSMAKKYGWKKG